MSGAVSPTRHSATLPPRSRALPKADGLSRSLVLACLPDNPAFAGELYPLAAARGRIVFTAAIDGRVYARHGTTADTRLTVIDRVPADDPTTFAVSQGMARDAATLLAWVTAQVPPRPPIAAPKDYCATTARFLPARTLIRLLSRDGFQLRLPPPNQQESNSPMRPPTGGRTRAAASPMHFMKVTPFSRSVLQVLRRIPPGSSSRRPWPRWHRPNPPTNHV